MHGSSTRMERHFSLCIAWIVIVLLVVACIPRTQGFAQPPARGCIESSIPTRINTSSSASMFIRYDHAPLPAYLAEPQKRVVRMKLGREGDTSPPTPLISDKLSSALLFLVVPMASLALPVLLHFKLYAALSVAKRAYVYAIAAAILLIGSARGSTDSPNLGERLQVLTGEILPGRDALMGIDSDRESDDGLSRKSDVRFEELRALDAVTPTAQSAALPIVVSASLALSFFLIRLQGGELDLTGISDLVDSATGLPNDFLTSAATLLNAISGRLGAAFPVLVQLSNVAVIGLFIRSEVERGVKVWFSDAEPEPSLDDEVGVADSTASFSSFSPAQLALPTSALLVGAAYLGPASLVWPVRNIVCAALGIGVVRAIQVPRLGPVIAALSLLVLYDAYSVGMMLVELGSQSIGSGDLAAASGVTSASASASASTNSVSSSAMGAVAMNKVGGLEDSSAIWQAGLLEVRLRSRVTDLLGLGDAVFPSLLSTFALRYDRREERSGRLPSYFAASMLGYGAGCAACELAPGIGSSGLPALLFIVPAMLISVIGLSVVRGESGEVWSFDPAEAYIDE